MSLLKDSYASFINLDVRPDRLERMQVVLKEAKIDAVRTRGIPWQEYFGMTAPQPAHQNKLMTMYHRTPGAIGCHYSQVQVMRDALERNQHAFVMEDDLIFCSDFHVRMAIAEGFLAENEWDVFWLGGTYHVNPPWWHTKDQSDTRISRLGRDAELTKHPRIVRTYGAFSTHAYIVNSTSIAKVMAMLEERVHYSIGIDYLFITIQDLLRCYAFAPGCAIQYDNQSNIGNGMTIFSNFKKLGPHWFQDRMEHFDPNTYNWSEARV